MKKFGIKEVVATGIGTALFIVLTEVHKGKGKNHSVCQRFQTTVEPAAGSDESLCLWRIRSV